MAIDEFEEVNKEEAREDARQQRRAQLQALWRAHPVLASIGVVVLLYALALFRAFNGPVQHRGSSAFLYAGIVTAGALIFLLVRLWRRHHRAKRATSDWT
jgi:hypothetical protein